MDYLDSIWRSSGTFTGERTWSERALADEVRLAILAHGYNAAQYWAGVSLSDGYQNVRG